MWGGVGGSAREWPKGGGDGTFAIPPASQRLSGRLGPAATTAQFVQSARGTARGGDSSARMATPASRREAATLRAEISSVREL